MTFAAPAYAQTTSRLQGHVEGAAAGTKVTATDTVTGRVVTTTINAQGNYVLVGLRPSTYRIEVEGAEPQEVTLPVDQTVTVDITTTAAAAQNNIVVTGTHDRAEVRTATVSTSVSQEQIENLPQNDRNFLNFAALAPGVSVSPSSGNRRIQAGAVSSDNTNVFIDGLSLKNPINHGGVAGQNFSQGNPFPQLAVQEFKVDTQNFKAEYEQAGSAIISAVTKTGGTEFHGDAFGEWQPKAFIGRPYFDRPGQANNRNGATPKPDYNRWQYGADIGGPIIKNKLHFFFAFEGTTQTNPSTAVNLREIDGVPASIVSANNGSFPGEFSQQLYFGKLTFFATDRDTINASAFIRRESNVTDFGGNAAREHGHTLLNNMDVYQLEWNHRAEHWLNEFTFAYNTADNGTPRLSDGPEVILTNPPQTIGGNVALLGANSFVQQDNQTTYTVKDNVTIYGGDHVVKGGIKVSFNTYERLEDSRSNGTYYFDAGGPPQTAPAVPFVSFDASTPFAGQVSTIPVQPASANNTQIGVFLQDDWTPNEHWTFNIGLRWDYETNAKNEDFVTPANVAAALRSYEGWKAAGIDPEDYISNGHNRHPVWDAFQPRLGVSYDVHGDRDLIFFAGAGRYYDRPLFITAGIETVKNLYQSVSTINFCNPTGGTFTNLRTCGSSGTAGFLAYNPSLKDVDNLRAAAIAQGTGGEIWLLNNDTKLPYSDQFSLGVRKRFGVLQTSLTVSHIRSHNIFQFVRGNRFSNGWFSRVLEHNDPANPDLVTGCHDGGTNWVIDNFPGADFAACPAKQGILPGFSGKLNIGRNDGSADYNAIYITVDKPYTKASGWGLNFAATINSARTNVGTEIGADEFFAGPSQTQFGWQWVQGVERYRFVLSGMVDLPWGIKFSGIGTFSSGPAFGFVDFSQPNVPENACCVANLGGVRFPTREFAYTNVDLRLAKTFKMPWGHDVTVDAQVYNVFDAINRSYSSWGSGSNPPSYQENGTVGNARTFQVGLKYSF